MKLKKVIVTVEELEARLLKNISQKAKRNQSLKNLMAKGLVISKADLEKLEKKYQTQLERMREEIDEIRARMITRETLRKWEYKLKRKFILYTIAQVAMCTVFFFILI